MWDRYYTPDTLEAGLELLSEHWEQARVVAGATDLILELERGQHPEVKTLIDISRIPNLDEITLDEKEWIHLGPLVTHNHCATSDLVIEHAFALARACWEVGAPQIRNRGTVAGNLVTASPANDSIPALIALGAQLTLRSKQGERVVPLDAFYTGVRKTTLRPGEMVVDIAFPKPSSQARSTFIKFGLRRAQAISVVNVAALLEIHDNEIARAVITLGSVAPTVIHAANAEAYLEGKALTGNVFEEAGELAAAEASPIDDLRGSAEFRREMVRVCTLRALNALASGTERDGFPTNPITLWGAREVHIESAPPAIYEHGRGLPIETRINGVSYRFASGHDKTLLRFLREEVGLTGTKEGCAEGECGACTVFLDGVAVMACMVPAPRAHGAEITTVEGLMVDGMLHPIQQAFIEEGSVQCGYCTPGFLMSGAKLLEERTHPTRSEIEQSITGNLCRCTGYYKIVTAFEKAAGILEGQSKKA